MSSKTRSKKTVLSSSSQVGTENSVPENTSNFEISREGLAMIDVISDKLDVILAEKFERIVSDKIDSALSEILAKLSEKDVKID